ncbi:MAG: hypothetical protein J6K16_05780 [Alphaproteobacteria bacterium]|nr:hypothetical protein [Alphaproteobacteria bacterium]
MIVVNDKMQQNYSYDLVAPMGRDFGFGFEPELTPKQMLELGVFEGHYLNDCKNEFPSDWFDNAKLSYNKPDIRCNHFQIKSRLSLSDWQNKGWILAPDVRGWFQWYCRYYMGRRILGIDELQIKRWRAFKRHKVQIEKNCMPFDEDCRPRQRQALLQWAYNPFI